MSCPPANVRNQDTVARDDALVDTGIAFRDELHPFDVRARMKTQFNDSKIGRIPVSDRKQFSPGEDRTETEFRIRCNALEWAMAVQGFDPQSSERFLVELAGEKC